jgi:hypothetical protein
MGCGWALFAYLKFIDADVSASFMGFWVSLVMAVMVSLLTQKSSAPRPLTSADGKPLDLSDRLGTLPLFKKVD